jgi:hypothetical protein
MATKFDKIYDLALTEIRDYKIDKIYSMSPLDFESYMRGFLNRAIPKFTNCQKDLSDINEINQEFNGDLTLVEQNILANWVIVSWLSREINDVSQINLSMNDGDFKRYAEGQNLKEKTEHHNKLREMVNQDMLDYGFRNVDWASWGSGIYDI